MLTVIYTIEAHAKWYYTYSSTESIDGHRNSLPRFVKRPVWRGKFWAGFWTQADWGDFADWQGIPDRWSSGTQHDLCANSVTVLMLLWYNVSIMEKKQALWLTVKVYSQYSIANHYNNVVYLVWNSFRHQGVKSCGRELSSIQNLMPFARWLQSKCKFKYAYMPWGPLLSLYW